MKLRLPGYLAYLLLCLIGCQKPNHKPLKTLHGDIPFDTINPYNPKVVQLGRQFFFDTRLSESGKISCATCHKPQFAFTIGQVEDTFFRPDKRDTPPLFNLAWHSRFFWDGGSTSLEAQTIAPFQAKDEMHLEISKLIHKVSHMPEYTRQIYSIWKTTTILPMHVAFALAQYERTLVSFSSAYDKHHASLMTTDTVYAKGYQLVKKHCFSCHTPPHFTDLMFHNNGLDSVFPPSPPLYQKYGRYRITGKNKDMGAYKTPSLRNWIFTAPYMHDGRFSTIDAVVEHYSQGVVATVFTDSLLGAPGFLFTPSQKNAIKHFLNHLNDSAFVQKSINQVTKVLANSF